MTIFIAKFKFFLFINVVYFLLNKMSKKNECQKFTKTKNKKKKELFLDLVYIFYLIIS